MDLARVEVENIESQVPKDTIHELFLSFGPVVEVNLHKRPSGIQHGSVQFEEAEDAAAAVDNMGGYDLFGKPLRVRLAKGDTEQFDNNKPCEYFDADWTIWRTV
ncbi:hypothetical protein CJU89_3040 [Yarrowia sp. B02]|nr:hypothetical protein CJU89_3040 [Yarrowia sp. B02]